ncbi:malate dehydrogenase (oxaloacetate-decarboxylating) [Spizellomyces sp. 'palustris']|nr:malate dehydrogenase (oxaloacetate-decarboxylating) [Spizellomyces sp. 'palustris']
MLDQNMVLYYRLLKDHLEEMLPIVYTPTEAKAIENYSRLFRRPRGVFLSYPDRDRISEWIQEVLPEYAPDGVDMIVVTDGEMILGIGDQGVGGIWISIAKLSLYTALGGIHPARVLPVVLDVGTDNEKLRNDPLYTGWNHERIRGKGYYDFVDRFVKAKQEFMPNAVLHWEDFGKENARVLLNTYRDAFCTYNDDMQGTAAIVLASLLAALKQTQTTFSSHRIVILGAGTAGTGIADLIAAYDRQAHDRIYLVDKDGLITLTSNPTPAQRPYAKEANPKTLEETMCTVRPTILIGVSTSTGAFTKDLVQYMSGPHPIIFPLSNPTSLAEADPADLFSYTNGTCVVATGGPSPPVSFDNRTYRIAEANNAFAYPGIGLGCIVSGATRLSDAMLIAAAKAIAEHAPDRREDGVLPGIEESRAVSTRVACAVSEEARREGVARKLDETSHVEEMVRKAMWEPEYVPIARVPSLDD